MRRVIEDGVRAVEDADSDEDAPVGWLDRDGLEHDGRTTAPVMGRHRALRDRPEIVVGVVLVVVIVVVVTRSWSSVFVVDLVVPALPPPFA